MKNIIKTVSLAAVLAMLTACSAAEDVSETAEKTSASENTAREESISELQTEDMTEGDMSDKAPTEEVAEDDMADKAVTEESAADNAAENTDTNELLADKGLGIAKNIDLMAENKEYVALFSSGEEIKQKAEEIAVTDLSSPKAVYKLSGITFKDDMDISAFEEPLKTKLYNRMLGSAANVINAANGVDAVAASSILTDSDSFICKGLDEPCLYCYTYDGCCVMVSFAPGGEDIVNANGSIVLSDKLSSVTSAEELISSGIFDMMYVENAEKIR